ncbi:YslB family protein [Thalassobacillus hwangdonensis]|uniref:YslB family protein n=1 Tax=Thalassobacillus hwangdonensis TaxID=546108 RepID=A0ABW3KZ56_9BACI
MSKKTTMIDENQLQSLVHTGAGFDLIRYSSLPELLGKDAPFILYYMGKNLARKSEFNEKESIISFFQYFGWGQLSLVKEKKKETFFELSGHVIEKRLHNPSLEVDFRMEAGFIAEAIQILKDTPCECIEEIDKKNNLVTFHVMNT